MRKRTKYKFKTSISREGYEDKKTVSICCQSRCGAKKIGRVKLAFKEQEVTVSEFLDYAVKGYAFCNLFRFDENVKYEFERREGNHRYTYDAYPVYRRGLNKGYFKIIAKADRFFFGTQTIFVDVDNTKYHSLTEYITQLKYKPTCAYYSYSDGMNKGGIVSRRFRLVYVFDSIINKDDFERVTYSIYSMIERDTKEGMSDICGTRYSQYMNGGNNPDTFNSSIIYSVDDFFTNDNAVPQADDSTRNHDQDKPCPNVPLPVKSKSKITDVIFSDELLEDMNNMPYEWVVRKWNDRGLKYIKYTQMDFENQFYKTTTEDFVRLRYIPDKLVDGQHRRKNLYMRAALRRLMKDNLSADELLYNLYIDKYLMFDNSDGVLSIDLLKTKVKAAMMTDIDTIKQFDIISHRQKFVINPMVSDKHAAVAAARRDITNKTIADMFDVSATVKANHKAMIEQGYKISIPRLYKWCNEFNIKPVKPKTRKKIGSIELYNPHLSIRKNMVVMNCTSYQVLKARTAYVASSGIVDNAHQLCLPAAEDDTS